VIGAIVWCQILGKVITSAWTAGQDRFSVDWNGPGSYGRQFKYPTTEQGLQAWSSNRGPDHHQLPVKGYLRSVPQDPWGKGNPYLYKSPGADGREYDITSVGRDGKPAVKVQTRDINALRFETEIGTEGGKAKMRSKGFTLVEILVRES